MSALQRTTSPHIDLRLLRARRMPNPWQVPWLTQASAPRWAVANGIVAVLYAGLGLVVGRFFGAYGLFPAPIWLPAGIACVASMIGGVGLLPGVALGSLAVNWWLLGSAFDVALMISASNTIGPWIGVQAMRAMRPPSGLFTRFLGVVGFILGGVLLHAAITAAGGTLALAVHTRMDFAHLYHTFATWWLCDSGGTFFFAPALLLWLGAERAPRIIDHSGSLVDSVVLLSTIGTAALLFGVPGMGRLVRPDAVFLLTVPLAWITLRISLRAAYTLLTLIYVIATVGTVVGNGPFHGPTIVNPLQSVGLMTVLFAMDALTLIALTSERRETEARLAETRGTLERVELRSERLRRESLTDPLTGIGNRRFFMVQADAAVLRAQHGAQPFALIQLDLDHFKLFNDTGGHATGDAALRAVAQALAGLVRKDDILARIGGEEFAIGLPNTSLDEAVEMAERLRHTIFGIAPAGVEDLPFPVSASFGVAGLGDEDEGIDDMLHRADAAVYRAKAQGRNRVLIAATPSHAAVGCAGGE